MEYDSAIHKSENLPFATTRLDLEGVVLSEISQTQTNTLLSHLYMEPFFFNTIYFIFGRLAQLVGF